MAPYAREKAGVRRRVPLSARVMLLFGGRASIGGWLCIALGSACALVLLPDVDYSPALYWFNEAVTTQATVQSVERQVQADRYGSSVRYAHAFEFSLPDGEKASGVSYAWKPSSAAGSLAKVRYPKGHGRWACLEGMRHGGSRLVAAPLICFPLACGVVAAGAGLIGGIRAARLLAIGRLAKGRLISRKLIGMPVADADYSFVFAFRDGLGRPHEARCVTSKPERLEDDQLETVVYDPAKPKRAVLVDALPGRLTVGDQGCIQEASRFGVVCATLVPAATLLGLAIYLVSRVA